MEYWVLKIDVYYELGGVYNSFNPKVGSYQSSKNGTHSATKPLFGAATLVCVGLNWNYDNRD